MLRRRNLLSGVVLAVLAGAASLGYSSTVRQAAVRTYRGVNVVVVTQKISARRRLEAKVLRLQEVPRASVLPGAYRSLEKAEGRVATVTLWPGDQVISGRTADPKTLEALTAGLGPGERGVIVSVPAETAAALHPEDQVDVISVRTSVEQAGAETRLISGVRVLKVSGQGGSGAVSGTVGYDPWVMLAVTPAQAQALAVAEETGRVRLVLRGGQEDYPPPKPMRAVARPVSRPEVRGRGLVEVIRGVEREL